MFIGVCTASLTLGYVYALQTQLPLKISASRTKKFIESCFSFGVYIVLACWGFTVLYTEHWPLETKYFYIDWPHHSFE